MSKAPPNDDRATVAQIAAIERPAAEALRRLSKPERQRNVNTIADDVRDAAAISIEIVAMSKAELIAAVKKQHDIWGPSLMILAEAVTSARNLAELINDAQYRLASALAVVEGPMMTGGGAA